MEVNVKTIKVNAEAVALTIFWCFQGALRFPYGEDVLPPPPIWVQLIKLFLLDFGICWYAEYFYQQIRYFIWWVKKEYRK